MVTIWTLDSCMCKLQIKKDRAGVIILDKWIEKCQVHSILSDENLLDVVLIHNRIYQEDPVSREAEKIRIRNLGDTEKNES